jgi:hypothetical protein
MTKQPTDIQLDKIVHDCFSASFMSDSKWVKLISTLIQNSDLIKECKVKLIWEQEVNRHLLVSADLQFGHDFYGKSMESMVTGNPKGWYSYKEIEWLDFPKFFGNNQIQNLDLVKSSLEKIGQFHFDYQPDNLRINAYQRT